MILIENTEVIGFQAAIRGMRNPLNSWDKSDSGICKGGDDGIGCEHCAAKHYPDATGHQCNHSYDHSFQVGVEDYRLMMKLTGGGPVHEPKQANQIPTNTVRRNNPLHASRTHTKIMKGTQQCTTPTTRWNKTSSTSSKTTRST